MSCVLRCSYYLLILLPQIQATFASQQQSTISSYFVSLSLSSVLITQCQQYHRLVLFTKSLCTKTDDNCSHASICKQSCVKQEHTDEAKFDAFQYYSNDLLRLKTLLLIPDEDGNDDLSTQHSDWSEQGIEIEECGPEQTHYLPCQHEPNYSGASSRQQLAAYHEFMHLHSLSMDMYLSKSNY